MQTVWVNNIPCNKNLTELNSFYEDYVSLKNYLFDFIKKTAVFDNIDSNKKILLKPNWVYHDTKETDKLCLTTHPNVILAVVEYVLLLKPASIIIGDSPVQSCDWSALFSNHFIERIKELENSHNTIIKLVDFRNEKWERKGILQRDCRGKDNYVLFDLTTDSLLEPLSNLNKSFRVGDYDPKETLKNHNKGTHKYLIAKEVIEADVVINLPKLKTHQKSGITNGLKNYVGTIGEKAYLAHHSSNLSKSGGDCYPGNNYIRKKAEYFNDLSAKYRGTFLYFPLLYVSAFIWKLAPKSKYANLTGAWYGNDTVWRMVIDINKIIAFGTINGDISDIPQRKLITISDAIIGGQGNGPLKPDPNPMGMIAVSDNDMLLDFVMAKLMGFESKKIPLLSIFESKYNTNEYQIIFDDNKINENELYNYSIKTIPPIGWTDKIEHIK